MFSEHYAKEYGVPTEKLLPFFTGRFQECLVGKADLKEEIVKHLPDWNWNKSVDELLAYWFKAEHSIDEELIAYIKNLISKGISCCLGTNQEKYRTEYMLKEMGFGTIFDPIFSSAYVGFRKPHRKFFQHIKDTLKLSPDQLLFLDDTASHIESAKAVGIHAELYTSFTDFKEKMKSYIM